MRFKKKSFINIFISTITLIIVYLFLKLITKGSLSDVNWSSLLVLILSYAVFSMILNKIKAIKEISDEEV